LQRASAPVGPELAARRLTLIRPPARRKLIARPKSIIITMPMSTATYIRTPVMVGKSTTRVRPRRVPALRNHVRPARSVAPHSSHEPLAVGRMRGEIHRGPIGNSRPAARGEDRFNSFSQSQAGGLGGTESRVGSGEGD